MHDGPILVTGAKGFIGRHVVAALERRGLEVTPIQHRWASPAQLRAEVKARIGACIHLGWYAAPADYLRAVPPNARSLADTLDLVRHLASVGCRRVVVAGSSAEYAPQTGPVSEASPIEPSTVYGSAKAMCHALLADEVPGLGVSLAWARVFNVIGPGEPVGRVVPSVVQALLAGRSIDLTAGTQVRDYIDVRDVATAFVELALSSAVGAFNISTGVPRTLRSTLEEVARHTGGEHLLRFGARRTGPGENLYLVGANDRIRGETPWRPQLSIQATAGDVVAWWREVADRPAS